MKALLDINLQEKMQSLYISNEYFISIPKRTEGNDYWSKSKDPDGQERDRTKEEKLGLEDVQYILDFIHSYFDNGRILDIGCADGDLAFFMESIGFKVDVLDRVETNFNDLKGLDLLKRKLKSSVNILQQDIDNNFTLIEDYSVTFALGILYHLRNPFNFLNNLCLNSEYVFLSTRIASHTPSGIHIRDIPVSYLLSKDELNNDPTNYWIFTLSCIRRLITRSGFKILSDIQLGRVNDSTPNSLANDERYFALLKRKENFVDIFNHHHF